MRSSWNKAPGRRRQQLPRSTEQKQLPVAAAGTPTARSRPETVRARLRVEHSRSTPSTGHADPSLFPCGRLFRNDVAGSNRGRCLDASPAPCCTNTGMGNQNAGMAKDSLEGRDVRQLDHSVSAALAQGVRYNMKILIRGQRKTGKTQLLRRLQGLGFVADYTATPEISTAHLIWTCPATDEKVKVEFWDVVDKGIQPQASWAGITANGKAVESAQEQSQQENVVLLDAETIDVYRGCDGVVLLHDPSRPETMAYSAGLLKELDADIPAIVVANFADAKAQDASKELVAAMKKRARCVLLSACCKDGFGMDLVRDFLTVPFLAIKARYAQRELSTACEKIGTTREKLDTFGDTLNFAAHCQQWAAGGAQKAAARQAALRAAKSAAVGAAESPGDPETPKAKMVPIEKLLLPPRIDDAAPDLGKEVASFNTGGIDESFFSSDDEMAAEVQVLVPDCSLYSGDHKPMMASKAVCKEDQGSGDSSAVCLSGVEIQLRVIDLILTAGVLARCCRSWHMTTTTMTTIT